MPGRSSRSSRVVWRTWPICAKPRWIASSPRPRIACSACPSASCASRPPSRQLRMICPDSLDQPPADRALLDDLDVGVDPPDVRQVEVEPGQVGEAADPLELPRCSSCAWRVRRSISTCSLLEVEHRLVEDLVALRCRSRPAAAARRSSAAPDGSSSTPPSTARSDSSLCGSAFCWGRVSIMRRWPDHLIVSRAGGRGKGGEGAWPAQAQRTGVALRVSSGWLERIVICNSVVVDGGRVMRCRKPCGHPAAIVLSEDRPARKSS